MGYRKIQLFRGLEQNMPVLSVGELAFTTDTKRLFIGTANDNLIVGELLDLESWARMPGVECSQTKTDNNVYITEVHLNGVKKAERQEFPQNEQGEYITVETIYNKNGSIESTRTVKEYKVGDVWKVEVT